MTHQFCTSASALSLAAAFTLCAAPAQAALVTYTSEGAFLAGAGPVAFESFEQVAARALATGAGAAVATSAFTVSPVGTATLGVQDGANSPGNGFGSAATDGTHYLLSYLPQQPTGTLRFVFSQPVTSFGLNVMDVGEIDGTVALATDVGDGAGGFTAFSFPPGLNNGTVLFFGFTQSTPFSEVFLTINGVDEAYGVDKVYSSVAGRVPEPGSLALALGALALMGGRLRRR
jgi:hypothetical protein